MFQKSSFSDPRRFERCVEVEFASKRVRVRNSKQPEAIVEFSLDEWDAFIKGVRAGEFDLQEE